LNDHIGKPFDEGSFYHLLSKWISKDKQQQLIPPTAAGHSARPAASKANRLPPLCGVDIRAGLALMLGDETRYRKALSDFVAEAPVALDKIRLEVDAGDHGSASMTAHILKGRTGLLGMKELHKAAGALEQALDSAQPTAQLLRTLEQGIAAMTEEIRGKLGDELVTVAVGTAKPPQGLPPVSVTRLIDQLEAGDSDCDNGSQIA